MKSITLKSPVVPEVGSALRDDGAMSNGHGNQLGKTPNGQM